MNGTLLKNFKWLTNLPIIFKAQLIDEVASRK